MFVQVIRGRTTNAAALRERLDHWSTELAPQADGFLGSTAGVTDDGEFITIARFESEDAARRNSDRPEQDAWWTETAKLLDGEATFKNSQTVVTDLVGDPDRAGFVQVMAGRTTDPARAMELMASDDSGAFAEFRPDVLGSITIDHGDRSWTTAIYFTSEAEAREGERKEPPPQMQAQMEEMNALSDGPVEFLDLTEPWLYTPRGT